MPDNISIENQLRYYISSIHYFYIILSNFPLLYFIYLFIYFQHDFPLPNGGTLHMSVAEYLTPNKNHLTHDTVTPTEQPSDLYLSGPRDLLVTKPSDRMTSSDSDVEVDVEVDVSHTATSSSPVILSSSYPLPPASSPTLPYPSALAQSSNSLSTTPSLTLSTSSNLMSPLLSFSLDTSSNTPTTTPTTTSTSSSTSSSAPTSTSSPQTLTVDVATTSTQRKALTPRGVSLPDSSDFYDDEIEEVSYGGVRPDVWCDDEPASIASRDLCTMEIISLLL